MRDARIDKTILVQAAPAIAETEFLLELAAQTDFVAGVVGWVDFEALDAAADDRRPCAQQSPQGSASHDFEDIADDDWMLSGRIEPALAAMKANGLRFDALVKPRHLSSLRKFLERHHTLPVVIDHGAKPELTGRAIDRWEVGIPRLPATHTPSANCPAS